MKIPSLAGSRTALAARVPGFSPICYKLVTEPFTNPSYQGISMTTCIDTVQVFYPLSQPEAGYIAYRLDTVTHAADSDPRERFLSTDPDADNINELVYERFYRYVPGITQVKLLKLREKWIINRPAYRFKIYFWLKPELLVTGEYNLLLFRCSTANYYAMQEAFSSAIFRLFPRAFDYAPLDPQLGTYSDGLPPSGAYANQNLSRLQHLGLCQVERVDISKDILVDNPKRFLELARKSYRNNRQLKLTKKKKPYLQAANTSKAFKAYDKQKELAENHTRSPNLSELLQDAAGVIRIEVSIKRPDRGVINDLFGLKIPAVPRSSPAYLKCGLIPFFFDEDWGDHLMLQLWEQHIGTEPWMSRYHINEAIDNSHAWAETKQLAKDVTYVISRKRSLNEAKEAYVSGVEIYGKLYKGTEKDFDKAVKFIRSLGVQPFRIPGRWNLSRMEADFRCYPSVHVGFNHLPRNRPGIPSATAEIYQSIKTKLVEIYESYKPP